MTEEERKELLNPIDSRIVALGLRSNGKNFIFQSDDEAEMLYKFWQEWEKCRSTSPFINPVGFNILNFDLPFLAARSFILGVKVPPINLKNAIDLREKINAYRYDPKRGKLKEFAELLGLRVMDVDGADVARLCKEGDYAKLKEYLENDLIITDALYKRAVETNVVKITKW
ncbi:MAG: hypothetical protein QS98_C0003G0088 [archaeon GW2011_AR3]|nr:MAG: hypothetical protein QS98_C0003G0088 [archaeon GW2011_AR3]